MLEALNHTIKNDEFYLNPSQKYIDNDINNINKQYMSFALKTVKNGEEYNERSRKYLLKNKQLNITKFE